MIDVILPVYNPSNTIHQSIDSVINQTYNKWHLFIINDCSTENNHILNELKEKLSNHVKITFLENEFNLRAAESRNKAILNGNGHYIAFIDQDDIWCLDKLERQINFINKNNADVVHGNLKFIDENNNFIKDDLSTKENISRIKTKWDAPNKILAECMLIKPNIRIISSMVTRKLFNDIGGFKGDFFGGEDEIFWIELALKGKIVFLNEILFYRRLHSFNTVNVFKLKRLNGYLKALDYIEKEYSTLIDNKKIRQKRYSILKRKFKANIEWINSFFLIIKLIIEYPDYFFEDLLKKLKRA